MKRSIKMNTEIKPVVAALALALVASPAYAQEIYYLAAKAYTKTMPDGTMVPMWGYVIDADNNANNVGDCWQTGNAARQACIDALPDPQEQVRLTLPVGENNVIIRFSNGLPEPTSLVIPGQPLSNVNVVGAGIYTSPTWDDGTIGPRTNANQRVRSFVAETPVGGRAAYRWTPGLGNPITGPGTFIFHSGTHPQKQVYMGLSGLMTQDSAVGEAYPGVPYDNEVTLFYSDIDPAFNDAVVAGTLTTAVNRHPSWFLVNGEPFEQGVTADIAAGDSGSNTLLRMASTATDTHVAVLQGLQMTIHAEDGLQYNWQDFTTGAATPAPRMQYSAMLPPAKTKDAIVVAPADGRYAVYDGNGYMTNPSDPTNEPVGDSVGGMLRFLAFAPAIINMPPVADAQSATTITTTPVAITLSGSDPDGDALTFSIQSGPANGSLDVSGLPNVTYTANAGYVGPDSFTYVANDGTVDSAPATVSITVNAANTAPVADPQSVSTNEDTALPITLTGSDVNGDPLTYAVVTAPASGLLSGTAPNLVYTPNANFNGADSFSFTTNDGALDSGPATVSITVDPVNDAPLADAQAVATDQGVPLPITLTGSDLDGDTLTFSVQTAPTNGVLNGTAPNLSYVPNAGYSGPDSFTFLVNDGTVDSALATVDITVNSTGTAAGAMIFSTTGAGAVPGVTGPYDDADVYNVDMFNPETNNLYSRVHDAVADLGLPNNANIDGISINGANIYVSFAAASTNVTGIGPVPDEDVVVWNGSTWNTYFDGSVCGLDASNGQDIDAVSVSGGTLYFSTRGGGNGNPVGGVTGPYDDADVYAWSGGTGGSANCSRALDGSAAGLPGNADIDGLTVIGGTYYISFDRNGGTNVPGVGVVQDESVVSYDGANWALVFTGSGQLDGTNSQDVDAIHVTP